MESWPNIVLLNLFQSIGYSRVARHNVIMLELQNVKAKITICGHVNSAILVDKTIGVAGIRQASEY